MLLKGMDETQWSLDPKLVYNALRNTGHFFDWFQTLVPDYEFVEGIYAMDRGDPQAQKVPFVKPVNGRSPNGTFCVETLEKECQKRNIPLLYRHQVTDIEMTDGRVSAVVAKCSGEFCGGDFCDVRRIPFILLYIVNGSVTAVGIFVDLTMPHTAHPA